MFTPPPDDALLRPFAETMRRTSLIRERDHLMVAASGGLTSTALLYLLAAMQKKWALALSIGHVQETPEAERQVRDHATSLRLPVYVVPLSASLENGGRGKEHALRSIQEMTNSSMIATGHTEEHQEENRLRSFLEGGSVEDLRSFRERDDAVARPLLTVSRDDCRGFLARHRIPYFQDPQRLSLAPAQNRVRLLLLPFLRHHIEPRLSERLVTTGQHIDADADFLRALASAARAEVGWEEMPRAIRLSAARFQALPPSLRRRILGDAAATLLAGVRLSGSDLLRLDTLVLERPTGTIGQDIIPLSIEVSGDTLLLRRP